MAKANDKHAADAQETPVSAGDTNIPPTSETPHSGTQESARAASTYSAADLAAAARHRFGVQPEVVTAAMKVAGVQRATSVEAERIINDFLKKEVK